MPIGKWFRVQSIGTVHRAGADPDPSAFYDPWVETVIEIDERWAAGLDGIEEFSHLVVLFYLDRAQRRRSPGKPRAAEARQDAARVGFFATRTPKRPNPIGIACPRLLRREGTQLVVSGIDAWPGTPVIDVKGYYPRDELRPDATVPGWLTRLNDRHDAERGASPS
jgi:tRNA-Thr(GGU) m(6)t(6)A37 methyltransferase TsaA